VLWGAALAFVTHCRVEEEASPRLDVLGRTSVIKEGAGGGKVAVRLRSGMKPGGGFIARTRREPIVADLLYFRLVS